MASRVTKHSQSEWAFPIITGLAVLVAYLITLQTDLNAAVSPYTTDVGEFQNALPRWGTVHFTGYPLYSLTGSLLVNILMFLGVSPAVGSSLVSALWGILTVVMLTRLGLEIGLRPAQAAVGSLLFGLSTSMWMDASIAEVHTLTMLFSVLILWFSMRFSRYGQLSDLIWLSVVAAQGVLHQRAIAFLAPAAFVLVAHRWRMIAQHSATLIAIGLASCAIYLYMPIREWMGSTWTFGNTSTWHGFWEMVLDTKAERILDPANDLSSVMERVGITLKLLHDDMPFYLFIPGLVAALLAYPRNRESNAPEAAALFSAWLPYLLLSFVIWEGGVTDALLAVKMPIILIAGLGVGIGLNIIEGYNQKIAWILGTVVIGVVASQNLPKVLTVTRDKTLEATVEIVEQAANPDRPIAIVMPWGHSYWTLRYASAYRGQLEGLLIVDHNASYTALVEDGYSLLTMSETFFVFPPSVWAEQLGAIYLDSYAPSLVEIRTKPRLANSPFEFCVNQDIAIYDAQVVGNADGYVLTIRWMATQKPAQDYHVAVHLVTADPPTQPTDVVAQADSVSPVDGWYPTTHWTQGQVVQDSYLIAIPSSSQLNPVSLRVTLYTVAEDGSFINGEWYSIPIE